MPWCPNCKTEYREGITHCVDCRVELVATLNSREERIKKATVLVAKIDLEHRDFIQKCIDFFDYSDVFAHIKTEDDGMVAIYTTPEEFNNARRLFQAFYTVETERLQKEAEEAFLSGSEIEEAFFAEGKEPVEPSAESKKSMDSQSSEPKEPSQGKCFGNAVSRYDDYRSSGSTFTILGGIGMVIAVLSLMGRIPYFNSPFSAAVLILVFGVFLVLGIYSYKKADTLKAAAVEEKELMGKITVWFEEKITPELFEKVDSVTQDALDHAPDEELAFSADELIYLSRIDFLRSYLLKEFPDLTPAFAEQLAEEFYSKHFDD